VKRTHTALVAMYGKLQNQSNVVNGALQKFNAKVLQHYVLIEKVFLPQQ
jgi:hypothetical protein